MEKKKALFICLGNICRSPIAEAVFVHILKERKLENQWEVDSAAIGSWHVGKAPDRRVLTTLEKHELSTNHRARQLKQNDFEKYDFIFGMDDENMEDLKSMAKASSTAQLLLLGDSDPQGERIIRDPYYDRDDKGFEKCYVQCLRCCNAFLDKHQ